jgi:N-acetylmuramoyl-L-alanine amidase
MVAVPLSTRQSVVGLIEAFSTEAFGFNDSDVRSLNLLAELILAALRPEEEERLAEISQRVVGNGSVAESVPARGAVVEDTVVEDKDVPEIAASASEVLPETAIPDESEKSFEDSVLPILAGIRLIPRNDVSEVSLPTPDDVIVGDNEKLVAAGSEALPEFEALERSNPGLKVVLVLVVLALLVGAGVWWKLQHDASLAKQQLSRVQIQSAAPVQNDAAQASGAANSDSDNAADSADARKPGAPAEVTGIRHWSSGDSSTVAIDLQDQVQYEAHRLTNPERIYFDLHDTTLAGALDGKTISVDDAFLVKVRVAQPEAGLTRVVLETKGNPAYSVSLEQNPYRLLVEIRKQGAPAPSTTKADLFAPSPTGSFSGAATSLKSANVGLNQSSSQQIAALQHIPSETQTHATNAKIAPQFRIVLDAGHGGWDLGTVGRKGLLEKDLVLDIVDRLGKLVESKLHAEVIYTRTDDTYLPLEKRAEIANVSHADLFLSIHANYSDLTSARGVETYYTNTYSSVRARTAEASAAGIPLQNANLQSGGDLKTADLKNVNWTDVDIRAKVKESHRFAASIQRSLYGTLEAKNPGLRDRGVKEASYVVLTGTSMPAVLAEVSFVSSPTDETELQNAAYRQEIAEALYKGLAHYTESTQKVKMASSTTGTAIKK